jgi:hypothetical protein
MPGGIGLANPQFPYKSYFDPIGEAAPSLYTYDVTTKNQFALRSFKDNVGNCFTDMVLMSDGSDSTSAFRLFTNTPEGNAVKRMTVQNDNVSVNAKLDSLVGRHVRSFPIRCGSGYNDVHAGSYIDIALQEPGSFYGGWGAPIFQDGIPGNTRDNSGGPNSSNRFILNFRTVGKSSGHESTAATWSLKQWYYSPPPGGSLYTLSTFSVVDVGDARGYVTATSGVCSIGSDVPNLRLYLDSSTINRPVRVSNIWIDLIRD